MSARRSSPSVVPSPPPALRVLVQRQRQQALPRGRGALCISCACGQCTSSAHLVQISAGTPGRLARAAHQMDSPPEAIPPLATTELKELIEKLAADATARTERLAADAAAQLQRLEGNVEQQLRRLEDNVRQGNVEQQLRRLEQRSAAVLVAGRGAPTRGQSRRSVVAGVGDPQMRTVAPQRVAAEVECRAAGRRGTRVRWTARRGGPGEDSNEATDRAAVLIASSRITFSPVVVRTRANGSRRGGTALSVWSRPPARQRERDAMGAIEALVRATSTRARRRL